MSTSQQNWSSAILAAGMLLLALVLPARAQVQVGDNINMNLNGNLSTGYTGDFSNYTGSDHGLNVGGNADLSWLLLQSQLRFLRRSALLQPVAGKFQLSSRFSTPAAWAPAHPFSAAAISRDRSAIARLTTAREDLSCPNWGTSPPAGTTKTSALAGESMSPIIPAFRSSSWTAAIPTTVFGTNSESTSHSDTFGVNVSHTLGWFPPERRLQLQQTSRGDCRTSSTARRRRRPRILPATPLTLASGTACR